MERENALLEVQLAGQGKESEAKVKDIARITHEAPVEKLQSQKQPHGTHREGQSSCLGHDEKAQLFQAMAELEHSAKEISQQALVWQELEKAALDVEEAPLNKKFVGNCFVPGVDERTATAPG